MNYTLHQLRIFQKVVEHKSITNAAKELHLTQPAVSIQLKKLQDQFDIPLVEVIGRQLYVTNFGLEIYDSSKKILKEVDDIRNLSMAFKGHMVGKIKISVVSTGKYVMPYFLTDFAKKYSEVEIIMDVTNKAEVIKHLENNAVDFALVSVLPDSENIKSVQLMPNKLFMMRKVQKSKKKVTPSKESELGKIPLIYREKGSATRLAMENFISSKNIPFTKSIELTSNEAVKQAVLADLGYSIMPVIGTKNELENKQLEIIPTQGLPIKTNWNLVYLKEKKLSPVAQAYIAFLKENNRKVIADHFKWYEKY